MTPPLAHVGGPVFEPLQVALLTLVATAYALRVITLSQEAKPVPAWRVICFASGLALIAIAFVSPLGRIDDELVFAHMGQHLLMGDLGALLIVLGLTGPLLQPLLANRWLGWLRHLAHPLVALPLWTIDLYVWHLPVLYQAATEHSGLHALQHTCFIGFGVLMWMPLLGPLPQPSWFRIPAKIGYLITVRFVGIVLGNVFMWSSSVFYPHYAAGERALECLGQHRLAAELLDHHLRRHLALAEARQLHVLAELPRGALDAALNVLGIDVDFDADPRVRQLLYRRLHGGVHDRASSAREVRRLALHGPDRPAHLLQHRSGAGARGAGGLRGPASLERAQVDPSALFAPLIRSSSLAP